MLHAIMLRGESTRKAELADLYSVLLPDESSECLGLVLRTSAGKTIPLAMGGNLRMQQYRAALRYRDPVLYPVGALAHWLVLRWEICGETPPDFRRRSSWYTKKVLPGTLSQAQKEISDDTQRNWLAPALEAVALDSSKAVHAMRQSVARLADMWEIPADQVSVFHPLSTSLPYSRRMIPLLTSSTDSEAGRMGAWRVGDVLPGPPASSLYEGSGRLRVGQGDVLSTAEPGIAASCPRGEAVALGGRRRRRLRRRRCP